MNTNIWNTNAVLCTSQMNKAASQQGHNMCKT